MSMCVCHFILLILVQCLQMCECVHYDCRLMLTSGGCWRIKCVERSVAAYSSFFCSRLVLPWAIG